MAGLTLKKSDFYVRVSDFFGFGLGAERGDRAWTAKQLDRLKDCVDSGCRNFYWPPPVPGGGPETYQWSFLTPVGEMTVPQWDGVTDELPFAFLPEDFGGFLSKLTVHQDNTIFLPIQVINEARMRDMYRMSPAVSGRPQYACERVLKGTTHTTGPKRQLLIWPNPDQEYTFRFQYSLLPDCLTDSYPFAYGGQEHSETILESCLRVAEERYDNVTNGPHAMKFFECMAASISRDRAHKPHVLGYNGDSTSWGRNRCPWLRDYWQPVTYNSLPMGSY